MAANPSPTDPLQAPGTGPSDKEHAALEFIVRAEGGLLPDFPKGIYPNIRFSWDNRDGHNRLLIQPRAADSDLRRLYRDFIREHNAELKLVCRLRQEQTATRISSPGDRISSPEPASHTTPAGHTSVRESDGESRVAPLSRSDLRKSEIGSSERIGLENHGAKLSDSEPEVYVDGYRLTEHDVAALMSSWGDAELAAYESGRIPKSVAYRQAQRALAQSVRMGYHIVFRSRSSGRVLLFPELRVYRPPTPKGNSDAR